MQRLRRFLSLTLIAILMFACPMRSDAYSILTHLQLVDLLWADMVPIIQKRFPSTDLKSAREFAYGGALMQDAGYYPLAKPYFSDYAHYIRSGELITNLFRNATDGYELAFAMGALTHYAGDINGHRDATNPAVARVYSKIFGPAQSVTYEQEEDYHRDVEFGFDINALNHNRLAPQAFLKTIMLDLALQQLTYAFYQTYGVHQDLTTSPSAISVRNYRFNATKVLPSAISAIADMHIKDSPPEDQSNADLQELNRMIDAVAKNDKWNDYTPGNTGVLKGLVKKVALVDSKNKYLQVQVPDAVTQQMYVTSIVHTAHLVEAMLNSPDPSSERFVPLWPAESKDAGPKPLPNYNLDTGKLDEPRIYGLTDSAYFSLLKQISTDHAQDADWPLPTGLREDIASHFTNLRPFQARDFIARDPANQNDLVDELESLATIRTIDGHKDCPTSNNSIERHQGFGMADTRWKDLNPPAQRIPGLCDPRSSTAP